MNGFWNNQSFHNHVDHAQSAEFRDGLERLEALHREVPCAILSSEAVWWRCHRRLIADYLLTDG